MTASNGGFFLGLGRAGVTTGREARFSVAGDKVGTGVGATLVVGDDDEANEGIGVVGVEEEGAGEGRAVGHGDGSAVGSVVEGEKVGETVVGRREGRSEGDAVVGDIVVEGRFEGAGVG